MTQKLCIRTSQSFSKLTGIIDFWQGCLQHLTYVNLAEFSMFNWEITDWNAR